MQIPGSIFVLWFVSASCDEFGHVSLAKPSYQNTLEEASYCYARDDISEIRAGFTYTPNIKRDGTVYMTGDVNDVLVGRMPPGTDVRNWNAEGLIGMGAGAIGSISNLGEAFYVNDMAHVRSTDNKSDAYFQTIRHSQFLSPFSMFVKSEMAGDGVASYARPNESSAEFTLTDLYANIYGAVAPAPFCFHGLFKFRQMEGIAVSRAPIYSEPLFGPNLRRYYMEPAFQIPNAEAIVFGCSGNFSAIENESVRQKLSRILYVNPHDPASAGELQVHSHALTVVPCRVATDKTEQKVTERERPGSVYHLQSNSSIQEFTAKVFTIDGPEKLQEFMSNSVCTHILHRLMFLLTALIWVV